MEKKRNKDLKNQEKQYKEQLAKGMFSTCMNNLLKMGVVSSHPLSTEQKRK